MNILHHLKQLQYQGFLFRSSTEEYRTCQLVAAPAKYNYKQYAFALPKNSSLVGIFNYYLKDMREKGILKQIFDQYEPRQQVWIEYVLSNLS